MVLAPGVLPLFFVTVQGAEQQLVGLTMFFAIFWGVAFWKFVIGGNLSLRLPLAAFLFAGIVGIPLIAWLGGETREEWYKTALETESAVTLFVAQLLIAGLPEELMKAVPVIAYLFFYRSQSKPFLAVLIGVFSALGFAAFENVSYHDRFVTHAIEGYAYSDGDPAAVKHTFSMLFARTFSTVFMHALTTGIFAYFLAVASISTNRLVALPLIGYAIAALGHTFYNTFITLQPTVALVVLVLMYVVFCAELEKLREMTGDAKLYPERATSP
jgi:RsiW-degrading membrane proteinase PrsW (M82 family)